MTQEDLDRLPEWPTGFGMEERLIDGVLRRCPIAPRMVVFADIIRVLDADGQKWMIGRYEGVLYKAKVRGK
jgi:hypothetical protein